MRLPCRHIFAVRKNMNISFFDPELVDSRWIRPVQPVPSNEIVSSLANDESDKSEAVQDENKSASVKSDNEQSTNVEQERFATRKPISDPDTYELMSDEPEHNLDENNPCNEQTIGDQDTRDLDQDSFTARKEAALKLTNKLAQCIAESTDDFYEKRMKVIKNIVKLWKSGGKTPVFSILPSKIATASAACDKLIESANGHPYRTILPKPYEAPAILRTCDPSVIWSFENQDQAKPIIRTSDDTTITQSLEHQGQAKIVLGTYNTTLVQSLEYQGRLNFFIRPYEDTTLKKSLQHQGQAERDDKKLLVPFEKFPLHVQQEIILSWFVVDKNLASCVIKNGGTIEKDHVVGEHHEIPASCTDKEMDLSIVRSFFTENAWELVTCLVNRQKKQYFWKCMACEKLASKKRIKCLCCLLPYHPHCASAKLKRHYFCQRCMIDCPEDKNGDPLPFENFPLLVKQERILSWFVGEDLASRIINDRRTVEDTDVVSDPKEVPLSCLHKNVNLAIVKNFFSTSAWKLVKKMVLLVKKVKSKRKGCAFCGGTKNKLFLCRSCLLHYNARCIAYQEYPRNVEWYCKTCISGSSFPSQLCRQLSLQNQSESSV